MKLISLLPLRRLVSLLSSLTDFRKPHLLSCIFELLEQKLPHRRHELNGQVDESFRDDESYAVWRCREGDRGEKVAHWGGLG